MLLTTSPNAKASWIFKIALLSSFTIIFLYMSVPQVPSVVEKLPDLGLPSLSTVTEGLKDLAPSNPFSSSDDDFDDDADIAWDELYAQAAENQLPYPDSAMALWAKIQPLLDDNHPGVKDIELENNAGSHAWYWGDRDPWQQQVHLNEEEIANMTRAHANFIEQARETIPQHEHTLYASRRGIVTTAGGYYFPVFVVSLRMLRRTGCDLPVEVFISDRSEYEESVCEEILPSLNARCVILDDLFRGDGITDMPPPQHKISHFQYKIFSMILSSFDEILFLDADCFPLYDPKDLFKSEPYKSTGFVAWPDIWQMTASETYWNISNQEPVETVVRPSTESGEVLVNKATHLQGLLLIAYYNYYGPSHYYPLMSQGGAGAGDKDTFLPALSALDLPFYFVSETLQTVGHYKNGIDGEIYIFAMIQFDPIEDYALTSQGLYRTQNKSVAASPRPYFVHANTPKWNPKDILSRVPPYSLISDVLGNDATAFQDPPEQAALIPGVDRAMWDEALWVACHLEGKFNDWQGRNDVCQKMSAFWMDTFGEPKPVHTHEDASSEGNGALNGGSSNPYENSPNEEVQRPESIHEDVESETSQVASSSQQQYEQHSSEQAPPSAQIQQEAETVPSTNNEDQISTEIITSSPVSSSFSLSTDKEASQASSQTPSTDTNKEVSQISSETSTHHSSGHASQGSTHTSSTSTQQDSPNSGSMPHGGHAASQPKHGLSKAKEEMGYGTATGAVASTGSEDEKLELKSD